MDFILAQVNKSQSVMPNIHKISYLFKNIAWLDLSKEGYKGYKRHANLF